MKYSIVAYYTSSDPTVITEPDEVDTFIGDLLEAGYDHSIAKLHIRERPPSAAGFPDHMLRVAVNADDKVGGLAYIGPNAGGFSKGQLSRYDEVVYYYAGHDHEFPRDSEIPLTLVSEAVKEFLVSGGERPTCVQWQDHPA